MSPVVVPKWKRNDNGSHWSSLSNSSVRSPTTSAIWEETTEASRAASPLTHHDAESTDFSLKSPVSATDSAGLPQSYSSASSYFLGPSPSSQRKDSVFSDTSARGGEYNYDPVSRPSSASSLYDDLVGRSQGLKLFRRRTQVASPTQDGGKEKQRRLPWGQSIAWFRRKVKSDTIFESEDYYECVLSLCVLKVYLLMQ
ncbi:hypothetical protein HGRIS_011379 [Hohenbuehelia grisea]|uniref:Uncharacterized protein n=1 Tax=Hohenbuehelia grisea TaxID=104357 RepID=A0ABR3JX37_9AGAR